MAAPTDPGLLARAAAGDDAAFAELVKPYQRPVFRHCYRMLGSGADAEDATQDTLERAWRKLATHDGSGPFGAWLQRIATNVCLDGLRARRRRIGPAGYGPPAAPGARPAPPDPELAWVEPVSDSDLRGAADPQDEVVRREDISLAFVAALQRLAPRQRAALLLHDVLGFSHAEVGEVLDAAPAAVNSLLSRARDSVRATAGLPQPDITDPRVQLLLQRYVRAWQLADIDGFVQLVAEDVTFSMPPLTMWFDGRTRLRRSSRTRSSRQPARMACTWWPVPATGSPRSRPTSPTARAVSSRAACRSCSLPRWTVRFSSRPWCPTAIRPRQPLRAAVVIAATGADVTGRVTGACRVSGIG